MTVCRFFQQGHCRYGQNCRYDHIYGSKYSYHANPPQQAPSQALSSTDLVNQVQADMQSALRGGQWILSCYSPFRDKTAGNFPGITDLSPEEARLFIYEAKNSNNLEQAINYMNNLFKESKQKYEQLSQPNAKIIQVLRSLFNGEVPPSPFSSTENSTSSGAKNTASSIFRSAVQNTSGNTAASIFSQGQQSIFSSPPDPAKDLFSRANNANIFGSSSPPNAFGASNQNNAKSIFASAVQSTTNQFNTTNPTSPSNLFAAANQSIFGSPPNQSSSQFGQGQSNSPFNQGQSSSPFSQTQSNSPFSQGQTNSPFSQELNKSIFGSAQNSSPFSQGNIFQTTDSPASIFGQANKQLNSSDDPEVYSKIEELSEADLEAFRGDKFELGFIPELPPPHQLCSRS